jgi:hypothetical protein
MAPMNARLLRPIASRSLVDADATAYLTAVQNADQQALEPAVRNAITAFVIGCKTDGIWDAIKASCILMGARTLSGALTPLKGGAPTNVNNNFVSGDYDRETGLKGNDTNKTLTTNRNNNLAPQDNSHGSLFVTQAQSGNGFKILMGADDGNGSAGADSLWRASGTQLTFLNRGSSVTVTPATFLNFQGHSRSSSTGFNYRIANTTSSHTGASGSPKNIVPRVFSRADGLGVSDARIAFYSLGESLDLALLDARVTALYNAIGAAI